MACTNSLMKEKRLAKFCFLTAIGTALVVLGDSYGTMLFLANYSPDKLPYLYFSLGISSLFITQIIQPWVKKDILGFLKNSHIIFATLLFPFFYLLSHKIFGMAFILSIFIITIAFIANFSYWNVIALIFNLREFKQFGRWMVVSSTIGGLAVGAAVPVALTYVPSNVLLLIFIVLIAAAYLLLLTIKIKKPKDKEKIVTTKKTKPMTNNPLFIYLFISLFLMIFAFVAADFNLKKQLALVFTEQQIGSFLAPFFAVIMGITVIGQFFVVPSIIQKMGVVGLIAIYPISACVGGVYLLLFPSLWAATILAGSIQVGRYAFYSTGSKIILNVFPKAIRIAANFQLKSIARNLATILAAVTLTILTALHWHQEIIILIILDSIVMIYIVVKINNHYFTTLKNSINLHRFSTDYWSTQHTDDSLKQRIIDMALQDKSEDVVIFSLSLLQSQSLNKIPDNVIALLNSPSKPVKRQLIKIIRHTKNKALMDKFYKKLEVETDPELTWELSEAILDIKPSLFISQMDEDIKSESILIKSRAICAYALAGNEKQIEIARKLYHEMINSKYSEERFWATKILYCSPIIDISPESMNKRFNDSEQRVVRGLIRASRKIYNREVIDALLDKLAEPELRYTASRALLTIGNVCREEILNKIECITNIGLVRNLVALLACFEGPKIEKDLIHLGHSSNGILSSSAVINLAYRTRKWPLSDTGKKAVFDLINHTVNYAQILLLEKSKNDNQIMITEINSRLTIVKSNYLHLLSAYFNNDIILQLTPTLLGIKQHESAYARALELLEICVKLSELKRSIVIVLEGNLLPVTNPMQRSILMDLDPWFKQLTLYINNSLEGKLMDIINKVIILRQLNLFASLSPEAIQSIAENLEILDISAGEQIFTEGDFADGLYILCKGELDIIKKDGTWIASYEAPNFFGELALLDDEPRYASAVATTDAELYFMDKVTFSRLVDEQPEILKKLIKAVMKYYRQN